MPGSTVDALNVKISANTSSLQSGLRKCVSQLTGLQTKTSSTANKIQSSFDGIGKAAEKVGKTIAAAFAVNKIINFGKAAIEAGSDLTEVQNVVDTVFGSMSESINTWSKNAMTAFGLSETSAKRYTSTVGAMLKSSGITGDALKTMSINVASLAADMASFYNLSTDAAFQKIRAGLSGETEPLKQLGINMSVANMEAYALSQGITKSYSAMSQAEQTVLRYNYLLSVSADAQHDFERTSKSWANQTRVLTENINKLKTVIGQGLIQALTPLINIFNQLISKVIEFAQTISAAFGAGEASGPGGLSDAASNAADTASGLEDVDKAAKKLQKTIGGFDELHILSDDSDTSAVDNALAGLTPNSVYDELNSGIDGISEKMHQFVETLKEKLSPILTLAKDIKDSFVEAFDEEMCNKLLEDLKTGLITAADIVGAFAEAFDEAWTNNDAGTELVKSIGNALDNILGLTNDVGVAIAEALRSDAGIAWTESLIEKWRSLVDMINGIATGLRNAWNDEGTGEQYIESLLNKWASVNNFIAAVRDTIGQVFASETGQAFFAEIIGLCTTWNNIIASIVGTFTEVWNEAGLGESIVSGILSTVTNIVGWVADIGKHFLEAWEQGGAGKELLSSLGGLAEKIVDFIADISKKWRDVWDNDKSTDIWSNLLDIATDVVDMVDDFVADITDAITNSGLLEEAFTLVRDIVDAVVEIAKILFDKLTEMVTQIDWEPLINAFKDVLSAIDSIVGFIKELVGDENGLLSKLAERFFETFGETIQLAIDTIATALSLVAGAVEGIVSGFKILASLFKGDFKTAAEEAKKVISNIASAIEKVVDWAKKAVNWLGQMLGFDSTGYDTPSVYTFDISYDTFSALSASDIPQAATGGVFNKGDLFIARERGPELVGSQNGSSVVMNNQQIVDAVSGGVASAISPLVDAMQGGQSEQTVRIRGTDLLYILQKAQKQHGATISNNFGFRGV